MGEGKNHTIAFLTLGCKLNYAETSTYERGFREAGLEVVPHDARADIYLVNTCSVTATSDAKSRNLIRKVHRLNPDAAVIVTGCSAQLRRSEIEAIPGVLKVFGCNEKSSVVPDTLAALGITCAVSTPPPAVFDAWSSGERTRSFLKIQDGCDNLCAYCTVPYARGASRSVPMEMCLANAREIATLGVKEVVLTGVNTGDYGRCNGESFLDLLKGLDAVDGIERYRISSIEPNLLSDEIIDWIASGTKFQPHFHIPLQTGSDELLAKMGRHYDTAFFAAKLDYVRRAMEAPGKPKVFFGIDVMVGLPGESDSLFEQTFSFLEAVRPAFIHVFPYSRRPGTPAAAMPGQVSEAVKKQRVDALEQLCAGLHAGFVESNRGIREKVLFESSNRQGFMEGYTGNYIRIRRPWEASLCGKIVDVTI